MPRAMNTIKYFRKLFMNNKNNMPHHLGVGTSGIKCAIITGDPKRAEKISLLLGNSEWISDRRGFICYKAQNNELHSYIISTGIGGPSTAIVVEELVEIGVRVVIRIGTCGALQHDINVGDLVIPTGCVREDGTTSQYTDLSFPAVPDFEVLRRLVSAASKRNIRYHIGITHCKDAYYLEQPGKQIVPHEIEKKWDAWRRIGVLAT